MAQLTLDFDRAENNAAREAARCESNRRQLRDHCRAAGIQSELAAGLLALAANTVPIVTHEHARRLVVRLSERALCAALRCSKSGIHDALDLLRARGLVTRFRGGYVVEWDAVCALPPADPLADLPPPPAQRSDGWSDDGRTMVGSLDSKKEESNHHPSIQPNPEPRDPSDRPPTDRPTTDRPPTDQADRLSYCLRWRHLYTEDRRPNREGLVRLWHEAAARGWLRQEAPLDSFAHLLGLTYYVGSADRKADGIEHPLAWLIAALRRGRAALVSWPKDAHFAAARRAVEENRDWILPRLRQTEHALEV